MALRYTKKFEINYHDAAKNLQCKLTSLVNFLCDVGNAQSESLGDTIDSLMADNMAWVFYKYDIRIHEYPKYRDIINIETFPLAFNKFYAHRGYKLTNEQGKLIAEGTALFFLIDLKRRRPMRIPDEKIALYDSQDVFNASIDMEDIKKFETVDATKTFNIRYSDIDSNGHVNNVNYMEWAIESVPVDIIKGYELKRIKVLFEKETTYGHKIKVSTEIIKDDTNRIVTVHVIHDDEGKELTKLEIEWIGNS